MTITTEAAEATLTGWFEQPGMTEQDLFTPTEETPIFNETLAELGDPIATTTEPATEPREPDGPAEADDGEDGEGEDPSPDEHVHAEARTSDDEHPGADDPGRDEQPGDSEQSDEDLPTESEDEQPSAGEQVRAAD